MIFIASRKALVDSARSTGVEPRFLFKLFVAGQTARSQLAIANLRRICEERFPGISVLEIIDVERDPARAEAERILTTPTVIKERPAPSRRLTGDLSDTDQVLLGLALQAIS